MRSDVALEAKVACLTRPDTYPERPDHVEAIETHMAWVFLTPSRAYKLKKPVRYAFLDFSTVEARRRDCEEEVRLNRRLAPDVYIETVSLTVDANGALALRGAGHPVDWLVKMRRLPRERMLDRAIRDGTWQPQDLERVCRLLTRFYASASPVPMTGPKYVQRLRADIDEDRSELLAVPILRHVHERVLHIVDAQLAFMNDEADQLEQRVEDGHIMDGHGDLRPEHIALTDPPVIIDCLEFNRSFRILDPADELAYLAIECERLGAEQVGAFVLDTYARLSGDRPPAGLIRFYKSFRALLRAKIAIWHLNDDHIRDHGLWRRRAEAYIAIAERYCGAASSSSSTSDSPT